MTENHPKRVRYEPWLTVPPADVPVDASAAGRSCSYADAIREALDQAMSLDPAVFVMGQDVDAPTAMFGCTRDLHRAHGAARSFDTPLAENAMMGIAVGAALGGMRPVYMHNRPDFLLLAADQLINHAAKWHYMFGGRVGVPLVVWACIGRGWGSAAQHSQALHGLFMHAPGLKLVMPSTPSDAKGLLLSAIADENPVLVMEHRWNFRQTGHVPEDLYRVPIGQGIIRRRGTDVTIVSVSHMVHEASRAAEVLCERGVDAEVLDLRTLKPVDEALLLDSVSRTGRVVVADCGWLTGGVTAEIAALLAQKAFSCLRAPIERVACPDTPTPAGVTLEEGFYVGEQHIVEAALRICS